MQKKIYIYIEAHPHIIHICMYVCVVEQQSFI